MNKARYTDDQVAQALATLEANGGAVRRTARETGIGLATLVAWRDRLREGESGQPVPNTSEQKKGRDFVALWAEVQEIGIRRMRGLIRVSYDLRAVAIATGIASDKMLDHRDGRKTGTNLNVAGDKVQVIFDL